MAEKLIDKSRKELVKIIFRKDDIYKAVHKDFIDLATEYNKECDKNNSLEKEKEDLERKIEEFKEACDEYASKLQEVYDRNKRYRRFTNIFVSVISIVYFSVLYYLWSSTN